MSKEKLNKQEKSLSDHLAELEKERPHDKELQTSIKRTVERLNNEVEQTEKEDYCKCESPGGIYSVTGMWGYWDHCDDCDKKLEDGFHYYDGPEVY